MATPFAKRAAQPTGGSFVSAGLTGEAPLARLIVRRPVVVLLR